MIMKLIMIISIKIKIIITIIIKIIIMIMTKNNLTVSKLIKLINRNDK